jgi:hypothetical protein
VESGQPNTEWIERVLKALSFTDEFKHSIAAVAVAKKSDFVQLHTADFFAHTWSTQDRIWMPRLGPRTYGA